ncbi:MAG: GTPase ObgE, partial [Acidimicrobiia bacterium]
MASGNFVDEVQVNLRGGDGGAGAVAFRREAHVPKGGPDGGDGGSGGDVYLRADRNTASLLSFRDHPHRRAPSGTHGGGQKRHGAKGADLEVTVPEGTSVRARDGELLADLVKHGDRYLAAKGGQGGRGNARFLSNARRAPSFAEQGEYGEEHWLRLEVKLLADAALVGFPNAGKSTLISSVSAAKPKIADYPFTTLEPHLGVVRFQDHEFVLADIPGLIEGAAEGKGLGHTFLRHVERARVLVILLDLAAVDGRSPEEQERVLLEELERYEPELLTRPRVVVASKSDVATDPFERDDVFTISAVTRQGLDRFLGRLGELIDATRAEEPEPETFALLRPAEEGFAVVRDDDGGYRVTGRSAERVVAMADLTNEEAIAYVQFRLRSMGVERAL